MLFEQKIERIFGNQPVSISCEQLAQFQLVCSSRNLKLEKLIEASLSLFKINPDFCHQFLQFLSENQLQKPVYNDFVHHDSKIVIYNNLAGLILAKATRECSKQQSQKLLKEAQKFLNLSEKVRMTVDKSIILNRAFLHYYGGQLSKAFNFTNRAYQEIIKTDENKSLMVTTMLMLAQINFVRRNYAKALELYKKCLETNKKLPSKARLGMAYSFFYLGKYQMARACFQRIIKLDPSCVQAYIGIAVVFDRQQKYSEYFEYISLAYKIKRSHPVVLLHLAQYFLIKGDLQKAVLFGVRGLSAIESYPKFSKIEESCRNDYQEIKARLNNIIGQVHHINNNYTQAIQFYNLAIGKGLPFNEIYLAQAYVNPNSQNYLQSIKLLQEVYKTVDQKQSRIYNDTYKLMAYLKSKIPPKGKEQNGAEYYYSQALKFNKLDFDSKIEYANILIEINKVKALKQMLQAAEIQFRDIKMIKPELENNIAVLQLQNGENQLAGRRLSKCIQQLFLMESTSEEQELKNQGLSIITKFNYAVCMQKEAKWHAAKLLYEQIIAKNKYHYDSYLRLTYVEYQLGNYGVILEIFQTAEKLCHENKNKILKVDKIYHSKSYLQFLIGNIHEAKETLKFYGKNKDIYTQVFQLCLNYENIMRKGVEFSNLKEFLRPNRQFCFKYCSQDHNSAFGYLLFVIVLLVDKKFSKAQGIQFFNNLKQFSSDDIPTILFNMGLFLMNYQEHENSNIVLNLYKQKVGSNCKTDQIIALNYMLLNQFDKCQSYIKKNIMKDPSNLKYRYQYAFAVELRCLKYYEKGEFDQKTVSKYFEHLKKAMEIHNLFSKINSFSEYLKGIYIAQVKQRLKTLYSKIKTFGDERKLYIKSYLDSYEKLKKELQQAQRKNEQEQKRKMQRALKQKEENLLHQILLQEIQSQDEQQKEKKQRDRKRKRALEYAKQRQVQMQSTWNQLKEKQKYVQEQKKSKKRTTTSTSRVQNSIKPRRQKKAVKEYQDSFDQLPQKQDQFSQQEPEISQSESLVDNEPKKKHKHQKKSKKHKKKERERERQRQKSQYQDESERSQKSQKGKPSEDEDLLKNYYL